jgi:hypothetical protein
MTNALKFKREYNLLIINEFIFILRLRNNFK